MKKYDDEQSVNKMGNMLWGVVLIVLGVIFGLNALDICDINIFFDGWWTLFLIIPSFIGICSDNEKTSNLVMFLIGVFLLLGCQDLVSFEIIWKLMLPAILIVIGISIIFKDAFANKITKQVSKINKNNAKNNEYCATFGGQKLDFSNEKFTGCSLNAVFGGVECDLVNSTIEEDCVINVCSVFGGVTIYLPKDVNVKVLSTPIFGGVSNKTRNNNSNKNTIYVNATCIFGGVEIK